MFVAHPGWRFASGQQTATAINVSGHTLRVSMKELKRAYLPVLLGAAAQISRGLGAITP